jgi:hypothetical protein
MLWKGDAQKHIHSYVRMKGFYPFRWVLSPPANWLRRSSFRARESLIRLKLKDTEFKMEHKVERNLYVFSEFLCNGFNDIGLKYVKHTALIL